MSSFLAFRGVAVGSALLTLLAGTAAAQVITVGPNINVSQLTGSQSETAIAISRTNTNLIALASNNSSNIFSRFSSDGGSTWAASALSGGAGGYDPWMGADSFGNVFFSFQVSGVTRIARSIDGGATYAAPVVISGSGADHPEMSIGPGVTPGTNSIYLRDSVGSSNRVISATSSGLGVSTGYTSQSTGLGTGNFGSTAVSPTGGTVFTSMSPAGGVGPASMTLRYDADGTGPGGYATLSTVTTQVGGFRPIPAQPNRTIDAQVELEYDFSGGVGNGTLYMLYTQAANTTTNNTDIVVRRSNDNGATFSSEVRINDDSGTNSQFFGRLAIDQTTGALASVWYDARNSAGNNMVELWGSVSFDGGLNWAPNFKISAGMSDGRQSNTGNPNEFGDYIAIDFHNGVLAASWADSSNSTGNNPNGTTGLDIYFARVLVTAVPEPSAVVLMALGLFAVGLRARRR